MPFTYVAKNQKLIFTERLMRALNTKGLQLQPCLMRSNKALTTPVKGTGIPSSHITINGAVIMRESLLIPSEYKRRRQLQSRSRQNSSFNLMMSRVEREYL